MQFPISLRLFFWQLKQKFYLEAVSLKNPQALISHPGFFNYREICAAIFCAIGKISQEREQIYEQYFSFWQFDGSYDTCLLFFQ